MNPPAPPARPGGQQVPPCEGIRPSGAAAAASPDGNDDRTGLPGVNTWSRVYWLVFGLFLLWVALLTALTRFFS